MFNNVSMRVRLSILLWFLIAELILGAILGLGGLSIGDRVLREMHDNQLVSVGKLDQMVRLLAQNELAVAKAITRDPADGAKLMDQVDRNIAEVTRVWNDFMVSGLSAQEQGIARQFAMTRQAFLDRGLRPAVAAVRAGDLKRAGEILHGPMEKLSVPVQNGVNELIRIKLEVVARDYEDKHAQYLIVRNLALAGVVIGVGLAAFFGFFLVRAMSSSFEEAVRIAGGIAKGDLSQEITVRSRDEMGNLMQAMKDMSCSLQKIVAQVRSCADSIVTASGEIAAGNLDLSSRTEQQASSLEETAASIEELTSTVKQNADNAQQANQLAMSASETASRGGMAMSAVVDTMASINSSAKKVSEIIGVVDGIAFQTNILALNASVEAARAGEQGRGFAVVAGEVRALSQRCAAAAKEIKGLIDESVGKIDSGSDLVARAGVTMQEIVNGVQQVTDIIGEIAAASREQTAGIEQVNKAVSQMDQMTQQNAALVEQAAAASQAMQDQAKQLTGSVAVFKVEEERHAKSSSWRALGGARQSVSDGQPDRAMQALRAA